MRFGVDPLQRPRLGREQALLADGSAHPGLHESVQDLVPEAADADVQPAPAEPIQELDQLLRRDGIDVLQSVAGDQEEADTGAALDHLHDPALEGVHRGVVEAAVEPHHRDVAAAVQTVSAGVAQGPVGVERQLRDVWEQGLEGTGVLVRAVVGGAPHRRQGPVFGWIDVLHPDRVRHPGARQHLEHVVRQGADHGAGGAGPHMADELQHVAGLTGVQAGEGASHEDHRAHGASIQPPAVELGGHGGAAGEAERSVEAQHRDVPAQVETVPTGITQGALGVERQLGEVGGERSQRTRRLLRPHVRAPPYRGHRHRLGRVQGPVADHLHGARPFEGVDHRLRHAAEGHAQAPGAQGGHETRQAAGTGVVELGHAVGDEQHVPQVRPVCDPLEHPLFHVAHAAPVHRAFDAQGGDVAATRQAVPGRVPQGPVRVQ